MVAGATSRSFADAIKRDTLASAKRGDRAAIAEIYMQCQPYCFGYFRSRLLDTHAADDLTQEAFVRVFGAISRFQLDQRFDAWLLGICRNVLREHVRKFRGRREVLWAELCLELATASGDEEGPYDDLLPLVPVCMSRLAPNAEAVLRSHYLEGKKVAELAIDMNRSPSAIKMLMLRARKAMKSCIRASMQGTRR